MRLEAYSSCRRVLVHSLEQDHPLRMLVVEKQEAPDEPYRRVRPSDEYGDGAATTCWCCFHSVLQYL